MAFIALIAYMATFAPGMGSLPWTINSELYPKEYRHVGIGMATMTNWISNLLISSTFLFAVEKVGHAAVFWSYAVFGAIGGVFLYGSLPETSHRILDIPRAPRDSKASTSQQAIWDATV